MCADRKVLTTGEVSDSHWYAKRHREHHDSGVRIADTFDEIKNFAYQSFDRLDTNSDGFLSHDELAEALNDSSLSLRERSFISFLLRRMDDIKDAFEEEWNSSVEGISRADIQEYFKLIRHRI